MSDKKVPTYDIASKHSNFTKQGANTGNNTKASVLEKIQKSNKKNNKE